MRMSTRRFTRLTNAFSKKIENHAHSVTLQFMHYNFIRPHATLSDATPAMAAEVTTSPWEIEELVRLIEEAAQAPNRPSTYKKNSN